MSISSLLNLLPLGSYLKWVVICVKSKDCRNVGSKKFSAYRLKGLLTSDVFCEFYKFESRENDDNLFCHRVPFFSEKKSKALFLINEVVPLLANHLTI